MFRPAQFYDVVDGTLSRYSVYHRWASPTEGWNYPIFAFEEWVHDLYFHEQLTDGKEENVEIFAKYKDLMECKARQIREGKEIKTDGTNTLSTRETQLTVTPKRLGALASPLLWRRHQSPRRARPVLWAPGRGCSAVSVSCSFSSQQSSGRQ